MDSTERFASSSGFVELLQASRTTGGIPPGDVLGRLFEEEHIGNFVSFERLLANGQAFTFAWSHSLWILVFQFHSGDLSIKTAVRRVRADLLAIADKWGFGAWFARQHEQLVGQRPVDMLDGQLPAVMDTARSFSYRNRKLSTRVRPAQALALA